MVTLIYTLISSHSYDDSVQKVRRRPQNVSLWIYLQYRNPPLDRTRAAPSAKTFSTSVAPRSPRCLVAISLTRTVSFPGSSFTIRVPCVEPRSRRRRR
ncbi:hypothetical protein BC938DRAFT_477411 [Jimgerdemannia flammicorona]|uniref:Uncharacterized protein n=1 Tax=Jimgerdemannia flammicorona TaxID=994334 RepID=A0A433QYY5_9FUNG|nr:hypothetical protein BC938DRAFT_477411 [Jimgerdemannia flammicorona]